MAIASLLKAGLERFSIRSHAENLSDQILSMTLSMTMLLQGIARTELLSRSSHRNVQGRWTSGTCVFSLVGERALEEIPKSQ
jgi:hypothetical protein